ncbi:hypothetical protein V8B97DRAFT_2007306 [Scleroderma yunnanense]
MLGLTLDVPPQVLPPSPPPKHVGREGDEFRTLLLAHFPLCSVSRSATSATSSSDSPSSSVDADPELEQHTLSSYGDLSFSDGFIISSDDPDPPQSTPEALQPKIPYARPRFRLKVRRPPMPKRKLSYVPVGLPFPGTVNRKSENGDWPGYPDPFENSPLNQYQPLISPLVTSASDTERKKSPVLHEHSRLKTSGLAIVAKSTASKDPDHKNTSAGSGGNSLKQDLPASSVAPAAEQPKPSQEKSNPGGGWRTRLPPRPPLPKWDI